MGTPPLLWLLALAAARAESVVDPFDVPAAPPEPPVAPAPASPDALRDAPSPVDPRTMRLDGFVEAPVWLSIGPKVSFNQVEQRFRVVDGSGMLTVAEVSQRLGDQAVIDRRKREVTTGVTVGSVGLALAAAMLAAHSIEEVNADPVAEPVTAITGSLGFVVGIGSFGAVIQGNERPWDYWSPDELRVKLTAWNLRTFGVPPLTGPPAEAPPIEAPPLAAPPAVEPAPPPAVEPNPGG